MLEISKLFMTNMLSCKVIFKNYIECRIFEKIQNYYYICNEVCKYLKFHTVYFKFQNKNIHHVITLLF